MSETIPQWAFAKADHLASQEACLPACHTAFARYIAQHEPEPVDPDLLLAREVAADWAHRPDLADEFRIGKRDEDDAVQIALAAIRRAKP